jgi:Mrp family chromosome partitioning ATPase
MSDGMSELIEELKKTYDYIILDTPPVGWFLMLWN